MECQIKGERCGFLCTGFDGSKTWEIIHKAAQDIECDSCRDHGMKMVSGLHDFVNVGLGKPAHDPANFREFALEVECALKSCTNEGLC